MRFGKGGWRSLRVCVAKMSELEGRDGYSAKNRLLV